MSSDGTVTDMADEQSTSRQRFVMARGSGSTVECLSRALADIEDQITASEEIVSLSHAHGDNNVLTVIAVVTRSGS